MKIRDKIIYRGSGLKLKYLSSGSWGLCGLWLTLFLFFLLSIPVFAQQQPAAPWWLSFEYGKQQFRSNNYGEALMLFEDARRDRRAMYEQMERDLIHLLSQNEVRRIGDALDRVERFSAERHYRAASAALAELYYRVPKSSFNNSASAALSAFDKLKNYPEAEYWIGEVYRVEGELPLALAQYRKALGMQSAFEDPGFDTIINYRIADILRTRQEYIDMEKVLHSVILDKDTLWANADAAVISAANNSGTKPGTAIKVPYEQTSASFARTSMTKILSEQGINRFMELYRYGNTTVEPAHRILGFYYAAQGRPSAEQHLMFAFLIQNSIIIDEIKRHQYDFAFTDLAALMQEINKNKLLLSYINEIEYFKTSYYLGASLYRNGKSSVARIFWNFLASQPQAGEWQSRAGNQLRNPQLEPIVEMP